MSTNSGVDVQTSKNKISLACARASASSPVRNRKRRTTSLPYRVKTRDGGDERCVESFEKGCEEDLGIFQIDSIIQSRSRIQGREGSEGWESSWTGSTGGGGVMLELAGTAETRLVRKRRRKERGTMWRYILEQAINSNEGHC